MNRKHKKFIALSKMSQALLSDRGTMSRHKSYLGRQLDDIQV